MGRTDAKKTVDAAMRTILSKRDAAINACAWQLFCAHIDRGLLDRLGNEKDEAARKAIATAACNALEAAEIFVKTVEE